MVKLGREEPVASMDSSGKIIWARHNEIQTVNVKSLGADAEIVSTCCCFACACVICEQGSKTGVFVRLELELQLHCGRADMELMPV